MLKLAKYNIYAIGMNAGRFVDQLLTYSENIFILVGWINLHKFAYIYDMYRLKIQILCWWSDSNLSL